MLKFVEENTPMTLRIIEEPDPMAELPGGKLRGRMVSPMPLSRNLLGGYAKWLRRSTLPHSLTYQEIVDHDVYHHPIAAGMKLWPKMLWRKLRNAGGQGTALMTGLIRGCMGRRRDLPGARPPRCRFCRMNRVRSSALKSPPVRSVRACWPRAAW